MNLKNIKLKLAKFLFKDILITEYRAGYDDGKWDGIYKERNRLALIWPKLRR